MLPRSHRERLRLGHILAAFPTVYLSKNPTPVQSDERAHTTPSAALASEAGSIGIADHTDTVDAVNHIDDLFSCREEKGPDPRQSWSSAEPLIAKAISRVLGLGRGCLGVAEGSIDEAFCSPADPRIEGPIVLSRPRAWVKSEPANN